MSVDSEPCSDPKNPEQVGGEGHSGILLQELKAEDQILQLLSCKCRRLGSCFFSFWCNSILGPAHNVRGHVELVSLCVHSCQAYFNAEEKAYCRSSSKDRETSLPPSGKRATATSLSKEGNGPLCCSCSKTQEPERRS